MSIEGSDNNEIRQHGLYAYGPDGVTPVVPVRPAGYFQKDEPKETVGRVSFGPGPKGPMTDDVTKKGLLEALQASAGVGSADKAFGHGSPISSQIIPDSLAEARKDDGDKCRMELIPPEFLFATATILTFGASKYADRNWELGMSWGRVFGALMRHLWAWWGGKGPTTQSFLFGSTDDETQRSHLWHACCCLAFLVAYEERGVGKDDRLGAKA